MGRDAERRRRDGKSRHTELADDGASRALSGRESATNTLADKLALVRQNSEFNFQPPIPKRLIIGHYANDRCIGNETLPSRISVHGGKLQLPVRNAEAAEGIAQ